MGCSPLYLMIHKYLFRLPENAIGHHCLGHPNGQGQLHQLFAYLKGVLERTTERSAVGFSNTEKQARSQKGAKRP